MAWRHLRTIGRWLLPAPVYLLTVLAQTPETIAQAARGKQLLGAGQFADAASVYSELSRQMPANPGWKLNLGIALHMMGKDAEAIAPLGAAAKAMPGAFPAHALLGTSHMRLGKPALAIAPLRRAVELQPGDPQGRRLLADAFLQTDRPREALPHLQRLTTLEPRDPRAWYSLARANEAAAAQTFLELQKAAPESKELLLLLAEIRRKQRRLRAAEALDKQAAGRAPDPKASALAKRIGAYDDAARRAYGQLGSLPDNAPLHRVRAETLRAQGKHAEAVEEWRAALRVEPDDRDTERELAFSLYAAANYVEALNTVNRLLVHQPRNAALHFLKGDALLQQDDPESAQVPLGQAIALQPGLLQARASLGRALIMLGRAAEAVPHLEAAAPSLDTDGSLHFQLSRAYAAANLPDKAAAALERSQQIRAEAQQ